MEPEIVIGILAGVILLGILFYLFSLDYATHCICTATLTRKDKEKWGRRLSSDDERAVRMDEIGLEWQRKYDSLKKDVHIVNDGFNLYGEYYDLGSDKTVIVLSGRTESLRYGYYFSIPYTEAGMNTLVIDSRGHGLSDGKYLTVGFEESKDVLAWARYLHENHNVKSVILHGICIGAAGGMLAITSPECPDYIDGLVTEGMFANFGESMKNHLIERKRNFFPIMWYIDFWMKRHTGHSMLKGPIDYITKMDRPLLMIQSLKDKYSTPDNAKIMYEMCPSNEKQLVLYETGDHSMLRITDTLKYDTAVTEFLNRVYSTD